MSLLTQNAQTGVDYEKQYLPYCDPHPANGDTDIWKKVTCIDGVDQPAEWLDGDLAPYTPGGTPKPGFCVAPASGSAAFTESWVDFKAIADDPNGEFVKGQILRKTTIRDHIQNALGEPLWYNVSDPACPELGDAPAPAAVVNVDQVVMVGTVSQPVNDYDNTSPDVTGGTPGFLTIPEGGKCCTISNKSTVPLTITNDDGSSFVLDPGDTYAYTGHVVGVCEWGYGAKTLSNFPAPAEGKIQVACTL